MRRYTLIRLSFFGFGALLMLFMVGRAQIGGDQLNLLARGYLFAKHGVLIPYGNPMGGGGNLPGTITSLVIGVPLKIWFNYHAPELLLWLLQVCGYLLLDRVLAHFLSNKGRIYFCWLYWLSPWHIFYSVQLWNPSYLYFIAAVHFWSVWRQRSAPNFLISLIHAVAIGAAFELHAAALILFLHSLVLLKLRYFHLSWRGVCSGLLLIAITLIPWIPAALNDPSIVPITTPGMHVGSALIKVYPVLRGILYSIKLPTFYGFAKLYRFDFRSTFGTPADTFLTPLLSVLAHGLGWITLILSFAAFYWFYRQARLRPYFRRWQPSGDDRDWLIGVTTLGHASALVAYALSPTILNYWQVIVVHHWAALPLVLFLEYYFEKQERQSLRVRSFLISLVPVGLTVLVAIALGSAAYRRGGRGSMRLPLRNYHPMLDELGLLRDFDLTVETNGDGWWMDVLPDVHPLSTNDDWTGKPWEEPNWKKD